MVRVYARQRSPYGKKKKTVFLILLYLDTSLTMMHIGCLDQIINRAWPFKIACGQWLALCWGAVSSGLTPRPVMSQRSQWSPDVSCCPAKLHCRSAGLHSSLIWSDFTNTKQPAATCVAAALYTSLTLRHVRPVWCWCWMSVTYISVYLCPHDSLFS